MSPREPAMLPAGPVSAWLDAAAVLGPIGRLGDPLRSAVFDAVRGDRDGLVACRLCAVSADPEPDVRLTTVGLLCELNYPEAPWPRAAEVAADRLADPDDRVRRAAAWLLASAGGVFRVAEILTVQAHSVDPVTRVALAEAVLCFPTSQSAEACRALAAELRNDQDSAVRLVASLAVLREADAGMEQDLTQAIRADLPAGADRLAGAGGVTTSGAGGRWARVFARHDREHACYERAAELLADPSPAVRRAGVEMAHEAMREWRAAPAALAPALVALLDDTSLQAANVLGASLTATRLAADHLAEVLGKPAQQACGAVALARVADARAVPALAQALSGHPGDWPKGLGEALAAVAETGADCTPVVEPLRRALSTIPRLESDWRSHPEFMVVHGLGVLGRQAAAATDDLIGLMAVKISTAGLGLPDVVHALGRIGPAATAAVPGLEALLDGGVHADEAAVALTQITGDRRYADRLLASVPDGGRRYYCRVGPALLQWLMDHHTLTDQQTDQLHRFFDQPGPMQVQTAPLIWRLEGAAATERLLHVLPGYLDDQCCSPPALKTLKAMGAAASPVVPALDSIIDRTRRLSFYIGDVDAEMRADERLEAAVRDVRDHILAIAAGHG